MVIISILLIIAVGFYFFHSEILGFIEAYNKPNMNFRDKFASGKARKKPVVIDYFDYQSGCRITRCR